MHLLLWLSYFLTTTSPRLIDSVDPFIGSGGGNGMGSFAAGNLNPGAMAPFPLLRLGPDTTYARPSDGAILYLPNDHIAGYSFNDTHILAFSHTHVQGGGCGDLGSFGVALASGGSSAIAALVAGSATRGDAPYKTRLEHSGESAHPGFYAVALPDLNASLVELVAGGAHSGIHRYTCETSHCTLLVDVCHANHDGGCPAANASFTALSPTLFNLTASVLDNGYFARQGGGSPVWVHLSGVLEVEGQGGDGALEVGLWSNKSPLPPTTHATQFNDTSGSVGIYATIRGPAVFLLRVGVSLVSPSGASYNLLAEQQDASPGGTLLPFEALLARTEGVWEAALGSIVLGEEGSLSTLPPLPPIHPSQQGQQQQLPNACPPPNFDPSYLAQLPAYLTDPGNADWLERQGLPLNASAQEMALHIWSLSCFAPPPRTPTGWRTVFYTALYHSLCAPTTASDAGGAYLGLDGLPHTAEQGIGLGVYFSDLSLWDIHRTQAPLLSLIAPPASASLSASLLAQAQAQPGGVLPRWPFASVETRIMCGDHGIAVLADAALKGVDVGEGFVGQAWAVTQATLGARDAASPGYAARGYVAVTENQGYCRGGTLTLEYGFDDACGAVLADLAGAQGQGVALRNRSHAYQALWSPANTTLCPRFTNGTFLCTSAAIGTPFPFNSLWTEADGLQMAWFAPGDPRGLAALHGSSEAYLGVWDGLLATTAAWPFGTFLPNAGLWYGNEPSLLIPWQALWAPPMGASRTQKATRDYLSAYYTLRFDGIPGNDVRAAFLAACVCWVLLLHSNLFTMTLPPPSPPPTLYRTMAP